MKIHNFTICDQIRQENTGKFIIIGAYTNEISFAQLPSQFEFSVWMLIDAETNGNHSFEFRGSMPELDIELFHIGGGMDIVDTSVWTPMGFGVGALIGQPGKMLIEAKLDNGEWFELRSVTLKRGGTRPPMQHNQNGNTSQSS